jgi:hypothetical protein
MVLVNAVSGGENTSKAGLAVPVYLKDQLRCKRFPNTTEYQNIRNDIGLNSLVGSFLCSAARVSLSAGSAEDRQDSISADKLKLLKEAIVVSTSSTGSN